MRRERCTSSTAFPARSTAWHPCASTAVCRSSGRESRSTASGSAERTAPARRARWASSTRCNPPPARMRPTTELYGRGVYRFLLSRQWVILTLVALLLIPTMIRLGFWQMHRYDERTARNQLVSDALGADPVPVEQLTTPGHTVTRSERYRSVTATGTFDTAREVVVRRRVNADETVGFHVLTPLVLTDGKVL